MHFVYLKIVYWQSTTIQLICCTVFNNKIIITEYISHRVQCKLSPTWIIYDQQKKKLWMSIQWSFMQSLLWIGSLVSEENFLKHFPIGSYVKSMSADGGHLEFPIGTKNITFVEVHPMIIHATNQFNWPCGLWQEEL